MKKMFQRLCLEAFAAIYSSLSRYFVKSGRLKKIWILSKRRQYQVIRKIFKGMIADNTKRKIRL